MSVMAERRHRKPASRPDDSQGADAQGRRAFYRAKRGKNLAILAALVAFVVLVYLVSIVRMSG